MDPPPPLPSHLSLPPSRDGPTFISPEPSVLQRMGKGKEVLNTVELLTKNLAKGAGKAVVLESLLHDSVTGLVDDTGLEPTESAAKITYVYPKDVGSLLKSAQIHKGLHDHTNIVRVFGVYYKEPHFVLFMERCLGSLREVFPRNRDEMNEELRTILLGNTDGDDDANAPFPRKEMVRQTLEGAAYIHSKTDKKKNRITHRDIKLDNVLVTVTERNGKFVIKLTDFDSAKELDVDDKVASITGNILTESYKDPRLDEKIVSKQKITIEDYQGHDQFGFACAMYEVLGDGSHLFVNKECPNDLYQKLKMGREYNRENLFTSKIKPSARIIIYAMTQKSLADRLSMEEALNMSYFHDTAVRVQALNAVNEAILRLNMSDPSEKAIMDKIDRSFFMVLGQQWQSFKFINQAVLKNSKYTHSFSSFARYCRNFLLHAESNMDDIKQQFKQGEDLSMESLLLKIDYESSGMDLHMQWVAKKFFPNLSFTQLFPDPCLRAYEEWMEKKKIEVGKKMSNLRAKICPAPKQKDAAKEERKMAIVEIINDDLAKSVLKVDPSFKNLKEMMMKLEKDKLGFERRIENLRKKPDAKSEIAKEMENLQGVICRLNQMKKEENDLLIHHAKVFCEWASQHIKLDGNPDPIPDPFPAVPSAGDHCKRWLRLLLLLVFCFLMVDIFILSKCVIEESVAFRGLLSAGLSASHADQFLAKTKSLSQQLRPWISDDFITLYLDTIDTSAKRVVDAALVIRNTTAKAFEMAIDVWTYIREVDHEADELL